MKAECTMKVKANAMFRIVAVGLDHELFPTSDASLHVTNVKLDGGDFVVEYTMGHEIPENKK